jgi:hypothetical protein
VCADPPGSREADSVRSGNCDGLQQLFSVNISVIRPAIHLALAVCLAGHLIQQEQQKDAYHFTACTLILLRDTGGGSDLGGASVNAVELRRACIRSHSSNWCRPSTCEWQGVLTEIERSFAGKQPPCEPCCPSVSIIELAMVVGASKFIHCIFARPPPSPEFLNCSVSHPNSRCSPVSFSHLVLEVRAVARSGLET